MNKKVVAYVLAAVSVIVASLFIAPDGFAAVEPEYMTPAFPDAEGSAKYISGARAQINNTGTVEVYHVTNLNDDGIGSFRDAVSSGNRIIVFDVSGMIDLKSRVSITHDNITVLGQTAPNDGICFRGNSVKINGKNIIMRYLRFRPGSKLSDGSDTITQDGFSIPVGAKDIILDHCSISWGTDENLSIIGGENITVQRCIISEALNSSIHDKGEHSYAGIWGGRYISMHHNIIASHKSRNPKIGTSETVSMTPGYTDKETVVDMWNNVFYNWGDKAGYGAENGANVNIVNNYYKPGPATPAEKRARIFELSAGNKYQQNWSGDIYANGNFIDDGGEDAQAVNADNWQIERGTGVYLASNGITYNKLEELPSGSVLKYMYPSGLTDSIQTAQEAYEDVLSDAGATLPKRDLVDARIADNVKNRTAPETGTHGSRFLIDDPVDGVPEGQEDLYDWRGYPIWESETRTADFDTDGDGIADAWEVKMGLDKTNPNDSLNLGPEGYTWLEIYGESLVSDKIADGELSVTNNSGNEYTLTVNNTSAIKASFYADDISYGNDIPLEAGQLTGVSNGDTVITAGYEDGVLKELKSDTYSDSFIMPEVSGNRRVFVWDSLEGMKPVKGAGIAASITDNIPEGMYMVSAKLTYADGSYKIMPAKQIVVKGEETQPQEVSGDFEIVGGLYDVPNLVKNVYSGIYADDFVITAGYNDEFKPVIRYGKKSNAELSEKDNKGYKYIKISVKNGHADLYAASTIGLWDKLSDNGYDYKGSDPTAGNYVINPENRNYASSVVCKVVKDFTAPEFTVDNIKDNSVIGFNDTVRVSVSVNLLNAVVLFNDKIIATSDDAKIEKPDDMLNLDIPVSFNGAQEGNLTVMCYNPITYQSASKTFRVYVSADASPWQVTDISTDGNQERAYMYATEDYTFKIGGMNGNIGGTSDECGYVYQQFDGNNRIYYRSRMQSGKQFGIMIRQDLNPSGPAVFFGGEVDNGQLAYVVKERISEGGSMEETAIETLSGASMYFIAEYNDGVINIYQTENTSASVYTEKKLIKSIPTSISDKYYMGFASVSDGSGDPPDCGWIGIDNCGDDSYIWNFDNGLDWCWQAQEANLLKPKWTEEKLDGIDSGVMMLEPDDDYSGERYVYREYSMNDGYVPRMTSDIMLTGEEPAINMYLQTGSANTAYKITFDRDNKIKDAKGNEIGNWEKDKPYTVCMKVGIDTETVENNCKLFIREPDGNIIADYIAIPLDENFRTQNNTKKLPVTKAVYFEPLASAKGKYYIDNVSVIPEQDEYKIVTENKMYTFENADGYTGMTINGAAAETLTKAKKVAGINFMGKVRLSKPSTAVTFPVSGNCEIRIYAVSANKEEVRSLVLNDGADHVISFNSTGWADAEGSAAVYKYTGGEGNIKISANAGVDVYGIAVSAKRLEAVNN